MSGHSRPHSNSPWVIDTRALGRRPGTLRALRLAAPVEELAIELTGITEERGRQSTLFAEKAGLRRQLGETVQQLRARWGRPFVSRVVEVEPWSRLPERRHALIDYEP